MASPELPLPNDAPDFKARTGMPSLLDDSREKAAAERLKESSTMRTQDKEVESGGLSFSEQVYSKELLHRVMEGVRYELNERPPKPREEILRRAAESLTEAGVQRAQAAADALEAKDTEKKSGMTRFLNKYRNASRGKKILISLGVVGASVGLAATGLGGAAIGVKLAHSAVRGGAAYLGAKEGFDAMGEKKAMRGERKMGPITFNAGERATWSETDPAALQTRAENEVRAGNGFRLLAQLESPHARAVRPEADRPQYEAMVSALREAQTKQFHEEFLRQVADHAGPAAGHRVAYDRSVREVMPSALETRIRASVLSEREQVMSDKKSHRMRKGAAILVGVAVGATPFLGSALSLADGGGGGRATAEASPKSSAGGGAEGAAGAGATNSFDAEPHAESPNGGSADVGPDAKPGANGQVAGAEAEPKERKPFKLTRVDTNGEAYTDSKYIVDRWSPNSQEYRFNDGESSSEALSRNLNNIQEYKDLSPEAQQNVLQKVLETGQENQGADGRSYHRYEVASIADAIETEKLMEAGGTDEGVIGQAIEGVRDAAGNPIETAEDAYAGMRDMASGVELHGVNGSELFNANGELATPVQSGETVAEAMHKAMSNTTEYQVITDETQRGNIIREAAIHARLRTNEDGTSSWILTKEAMQAAIDNNTRG